MVYRSNSTRHSYIAKKRTYAGSPFSARRYERKSRQRLILTIISALVFVYALLMWILPTFISGVSLLNSFKTTPTASNGSEDAAIAPPVFNVPYEATATAKINIPGYALLNTEVELYIDDTLKDTIRSDENGSFIFRDIELSLGRNSLYGKTLDDKGKKSLASKTIVILLDNSQPTLELNDPQDGITVKDSKITVSGTVGATESMQVDINGIRVILSSDGSFSRTINLNTGENTIVTRASDMAGNTTQVSRTVFYQPDNTPTPNP